LAYRAGCSYKIKFTGNFTHLLPLVRTIGSAHFIKHERAWHVTPVSNDQIETMVMLQDDATISDAEMEAWVTHCRECGSTRVAWVNAESTGRPYLVNVRTDGTHHHIPHAISCTGIWSEDPVDYESDDMAER